MTIEPDTRIEFDFSTDTDTLRVAPFTRSTINLAALSLTVSRWNAAEDITVALHTPCSDLDARLLLHIDDKQPVGQFLAHIDALLAEARLAGRTPTEPDSADIIITSNDNDICRGSIDFAGQQPNMPAGFVDDARAAVVDLTTLDGPLEQVRCIAEHRRAAVENLTGATVPARSIDEMFGEQVVRRPHQVAVRDATISLTYQELAAEADRYAQLLGRAGVRHGSTVVIAINRSVAEIVALLAVIRLGAAYVGFDTDAPPARACRIIGTLKPAAAVVDLASSEHPAFQGLPQVRAWHPGQGPEKVLPPQTSNDPTDVAYIAFTSGSTGDPKGVIVTHQAVCRLALTRELQMRPDDRVMRMAPLAFDASTFEIWITLLCGAVLEVLPVQTLSPRNLDKFFSHQKISIAGLPASLFRLIATSRPAAFEGLRWIVTGGEVVPHESVAQVLAQHPHLTITNGYGPTENALFTTSYSVGDVSEVDGPLPIGRPIAGTQVFVLDRNARLLPPGAIGELYAAGMGLANGYLNNTMETAERFGCFSADTPQRLYRTGDLVRLDPLGRLQYLGRTDKQVKLNGHRIETDEVAAALLRHPSVLDAVVIAAPRPARTVQLVAAILPHSSHEADPKALRRYILQVLPNYMVPSLWVFVDQFPLTRNGKLDETYLFNAARPVTHAPQRLFLENA
ncbi:amino acid adenylation domain-containing protein [Mycobacterium sp. MUNTM1]